jgi:hypothetical protein
MLPSFRVVMLLISEVEKGCELGIGFQDDVPAFSAVAPVGATAGNKFLTAKADAAVSSVSALDEDFCLIDKFDG